LQRNLTGFPGVTSAQKCKGISRVTSASKDAK